MAKTGPLDPRLAREMASLHGINLEAQRLEGQAKDVETNLRRLDQVSEDELRDVEPAFVQPLKLSARRRRR